MYNASVYVYMHGSSFMYMRVFHMCICMDRVYMYMRVFIGVLHGSSLLSESLYGICMDRVYMLCECL